MKTSTLIYITIILTIIFFILGYFITTLYFKNINNFFADRFSNLEFVKSKMHSQFIIHILHSVSFAMIPLICLITNLLLKKIKNRVINVSRYLVHILFLVSGYIVGGFIKFIQLNFWIKDFNIEEFNQYKQILSAQELNFYLFGILATIATGILIIIFTKKKISPINDAS